MSSLETVASLTATAGWRNDERRRAYVRRVFDLAFISLALSGLIALALSALVVTRQAERGVVPLTDDGRYLTAFGAKLFGWLATSGWIGWGILILPLALVIWLVVAVHMKSTRYATVLAIYLGFTATLSFVLALCVVLLPTAMVLTALAVTTVMVGSISAWGYTTKRDLSAWGYFLFAGLLGLVALETVNLFLGLGKLELLGAIGGVVVFSGYIAYDVQSIKAGYDPTLSDEELSKKALFDAAGFYLDVLNLFVSLLELLSWFQGGKSSTCTTGTRV